MTHFFFFLDLINLGLRLLFSRRLDCRASNGGVQKLRSSVQVLLKCPVLQTAIALLEVDLVGDMMQTDLYF